MAAVQLNFTLRTSSNCKTVHLLGSWDGYKNQLPLSKDPTSAKPGGWKGTFRFQGTTLKQGGRYWYYYIIDGYHVSHDPARDSITEPTTGRKLNVLDIPKSPSSMRSAAAAPAPAKSSHSSHTRRISTSSVPKGRALSPSQIKSPRPTKPHETRAIATEQYDRLAMDHLAMRVKNQQLSDSDSDSDETDSDSDSDSGSDVPSLSSRSSNSSSPSSISSASSTCTCDRYGITRSGNRVKLDCGGVRCGYSDHGSECSSESDEEYRRHVGKGTRRQGMIVRR